MSNSHNWKSPDFSTCAKCGDKDWMADKHCSVSDEEYIEKLQAENEELKRALELKHPVLDHMEQDINKIKADAIREYIETRWTNRIDIENVELWKLLRDAEKYTNNLEDKQ